MLKHGDYVFVSGGVKNACKVVDSRNEQGTLFIINPVSDSIIAVVNQKGESIATGNKIAVKINPANAESKLALDVSSGSRVACYVSDTRHGLSKKQEIAIIVKYADKQFIDDDGFGWRYALEIAEGV